MRTFGAGVDQVKAERTNEEGLVPASEQARLNNRFHYALQTAGEAYPWVQKSWDDINNGPGKNKKKARGRQFGLRVASRLSGRTFGEATLARVSPSVG